MDSENRVPVLIVDDEATFCSFLSEGIALVGEGRYEAVCVHSVDSALEQIEEQDFGAVVTDIRMPGKDGLQLLLDLKRRSMQIPTIVMTAYGSPSVHAEAAKRGAIRYIEKPFRFEDLISLLDGMLSDQTHFRTRSGLDIIEVVEMLCVGNKDMAVRVRTDDGDGMIFVQDGDIIHAEYLGRAGPGAFHEIVSFRNAVISTDPSGFTDERSITRGWKDLTEEAWRRRTSATRTAFSSIKEVDSSIPVQPPLFSRCSVDDVMNSMKTKLPGTHHPELISHDDEGGEQVAGMEQAAMGFGGLLNCGAIVSIVVKEHRQSWVVMPLGRGRTLTAIADGKSRIESDLRLYAKELCSSETEEAIE